MKIKEIIQALETFAPKSLQESYDNAGLQVGDVEAQASAALLCLDVTEDIIDEAIAMSANLIIAHHPLIFKGLKSIGNSNYIDRCIVKAIKNDICIYASHTNLDSANGGVNFKIAEKLGLQNVKVLDQVKNMLCKIGTFVPAAHSGMVRQAMFEAGAGQIGNYDACSYNSEGYGTFRAGFGAEPFCGEVGELHIESELRIEMIVPSYNCSQVVKALIKAHPYEEPAYDIIALQNQWSETGIGVYGELSEEMDETEFLLQMKSIFQTGAVRHSSLRNKKIKRVALCGGSGSYLIPKAIGAGCDVFLTGEIKYHDFFGADEQILLADLGHYETEQFTKELFRDIISKKFPTFVTHFAKVRTNPINYL